MCATCKEWRHSLYCGRDECPTPDPAIAAERERSAAAARLRANRPPVHCRVLSIGAECTCYLCDIDRLVGAAPQAPAPPLLPHQDVARELRKLVMKRQTEMPWSSGHNGEPYIDGPALAAWEKETDRQIEAALARRAPADQTDVEAMVERLRAPGIHRTQTVLEAARMLEDMAAVPPAPADQGQRETLEQIAQAEAGSLLGGFDYTGPISRQDIERRILAALQRAREAE